MRVNSRVFSERTKTDNLNLWTRLTLAYFLRCVPMFQKILEEAWERNLREIKRDLERFVNEGK